MTIQHLSRILLALYIILSNAAYTQSTTITNPILAGFYPDPSIVKVGGDYYLVNSTFSYFPGLPVFHSKDLKNWKQVGNVISRPSQMNFMGHRMTRGLFAPAIDYHNGLFYVTCTLRSEEHTSELQSRLHLVCRLLLEKKKKKQ